MRASLVAGPNVPRPSPPRASPNPGGVLDARKELALPEYFAAAAEGVTEEDIADAVPHGPDPEPMLEEIRAYADAGFTHAYVHQIGPDQQGFLDFARRELLPRVQNPAGVR